MCSLELDSSVEGLVGGGWSVDLGDLNLTIVVLTLDILVQVDSVQVLDEGISDNSVLNGLFNWGGVLTDNFWNTDDLSINDLDITDGGDWVNNVLSGQDLDVGDDFSNGVLVQEEITVDFLQQVLDFDVVDVGSLLSEDSTLGVVETFVLTTENIVINVVADLTVDWAVRLNVDWVVLLGNVLDLRVDVLVEKNGVLEVFLELTVDKVLLEELRGDVTLEDGVFQVLTEKGDGEVFTEDFGLVQFFDGVHPTSLHLVVTNSSQTLQQRKTVDALVVYITNSVQGQRKTVKSSNFPVVLSVEDGVVSSQLLAQRASGHRGDEEGDSDESLHVL